MVMFAAPSTRLFLGWQRDANALFQWGLDGAADQLDLRSPGRGVARLGVLALFTGAGLIVNSAFSLTAHDESHMEAARAIGATAVGLVRSSDGVTPMGIGEFFLEAFNFTYEPGLYWYTKDNATLDEQAYVASEGLDTNMLIADATGRKIDEGDGAITDLAPYVLNKLWGIRYFLDTGPTSDAGNYVSLLNQMGYAAVTRGNVIALHAVSFALSGGFLSLARGAWDFIARGDTAVNPLALTLAPLSVCWPELTTWLNPENVSLLVSVDAAWKDFMFMRLGLDTPVLGNTGLGPELTLGAKVKIHGIGAGVEITSQFVKFPFLAGSVAFDLGDGVSIGIEGFYGQGNTMREKREHPLGPGATGFLTARL